MNLTKKLLFSLALAAGLLIGMKFVFRKDFPLAPHDSTTYKLQPTTFLSPFPTVISSPKFSRILLDTQELSVEVASTSEEKVQGLSGRSGIGSDGMLFLMDTPQVAVFWMKDMHFPIDIVWIKDRKVIGFVEDTPAPASETPDAKLPTYSSKKLVDQVLELPAGYVKQHAVTVGSLFTIQ